MVKDYQATSQDGTALDLLADALRANRQSETVVCAVGGGNLRLSKAVARLLNSPVEIVCVRPVYRSATSNEVIGATTDDCVVSLAPGIEIGFDNREMAEIVGRQAREAFRERLDSFGFHPSTDLFGRPVIIVDSGRTDQTEIAAVIESIRLRNACRITVAAESLSAEAYATCRILADEIVVLRMPEDAEAAERRHSEMLLLSIRDIATHVALDRATRA